MADVDDRLEASPTVPCPFGRAYDFPLSKRDTLRRVLELGDYEVDLAQRETEELEQKNAALQRALTLAQREAEIAQKEAEVAQQEAEQRQVVRSSVACSPARAQDFPLSRQDTVCRALRLSEVEANSAQRAADDLQEENEALRGALAGVEQRQIERLTPTPSRAQAWRAPSRSGSIAAVRWGGSDDVPWIRFDEKDLPADAAVASGELVLKPGEHVEMIRGRVDPERSGSLWVNIITSHLRDATAGRPSLTCKAPSFSFIAPKFHEIIGVKLDKDARIVGVETALLKEIER